MRGWDNRRGTWLKKKTRKSREEEEDTDAQSETEQAKDTRTSQSTRKEEPGRRTVDRVALKDSSLDFFHLRRYDHHIHPRLLDFRSSAVTEYTTLCPAGD